MKIKSPVDAEVVAPDGRSIASDFVSIPGASFEVIDDGDDLTTTSILRANKIKVPRMNR